MSDLKATPLTETPMLAEYYQKRFNELQARFLGSQTEDEADEIARDLTPIANWLAAREREK